MTNKTLQEGGNKGQKKLYDIQKTNKMVNVSPSLSVIILNGLNCPTKRHRLAEWFKKHDLTNAVYKRLTLDLKTEIA